MRIFICINLFIKRNCIICNFRDNIKQYAFKNKQYELLKMTDKIRDYDLPNLNIIIEDKGKDKSIWKFNLN